MSGTLQCALKTLLNEAIILEIGFAIVEINPGVFNMCIVSVERLISA